MQSLWKDRPKISYRSLLYKSRQYLRVAPQRSHAVRDEPPPLGAQRSLAQIPVTNINRATPVTIHTAK